MLEFCPVNSGERFRASWPSCCICCIHSLRTWGTLYNAKLGLEVIKYFMFSSVEHEIFLLINVKMPAMVGILTFMSRKNSILVLSEPEKN